MSITSFEFLVFLLAAVIIYYLVPQKAKLYFLMIISVGFYCFWGIPYTILLVLNSLCIYFLGIRCESGVSDQKEKIDKIDGPHEEIIGPAKEHNIISASDQKKRKKFLVLGIIIMLGELFIFKYLNFSISQINSLLGKNDPEASKTVLNIIMPVGISFYVFQSIGYLSDVYRGKTKAERNAARFLLFISFFPKIIQGPIERSNGFLKQVSELESRSKFNYQEIQNGLITILWGFFLKLVIADRLGVIVDNVYSKYFIYGTAELLFTSFCYTFQIFCDFAGYTAIALGSARLFGFDLIQNFNCPYLSGSLKEFWRRWHISLSQWFRDYVYIPLGGSRCSVFRKRINIFTVMVLSGIWHGAGWTFIVWGILHGLYQIIEDLISPMINKINKKFHIPADSVSYKIGNIFITFNLVNFAWIFFRAESFGKAFDYIRCMLTNYDPWAFFDGSLLKLGLDQTEINVLCIAMIILIIVELIQYRYNIQFYRMLQNQCLWFKWGVIILLITIIWVFGEYGPAFDSSSFIYQSF